MARHMAVHVGAVPAPTGWPPTQPLRGFDQWSEYSGDISGSGLTDLGGAVVSGNNVTIEGSKNFILGTPSQKLTGTTTVRGCLFTAQGTNAAAVAPGVAGDLLMEFCTIRPDNLTDHTTEPQGPTGYQYGIVADGTSSSPGTWNGFVDGAMEIRNTHMWGFGNATKVVGSTQADPYGFYDCVVESPRLNNIPGYDDHTDGIGSPGGGSNLYFTVDGCWIIGPSADTNGLAFQNTPSAGDYDNMTINGCVMGGFGNMIQISNGSYPTIASPDNLTFTNNVLYTLYPPILSPFYDSAIWGGTGLTWSGNKAWVPEAATWGDSATQDGLFWIPSAATISGSGSSALAPFVSATDYGG